MATYAIGDIQGCFDELRRLLDAIGFDPNSDRLWSVGDLVNRGPQSLEVLRWFKALGDRGVVVLGNHDLHLLAVAAGSERRGKKDTLDAILAAPDRDELLDWLRHRPLLHLDRKKRFVMIHAGLPPQWDLDQAIACAGELEQVLRGPDHQAFLQMMYGNEPSRWSDDLQGTERLRFITNCLTRLRWCDANGNLLLHEKGRPGTQGADAIPWFQVPGRRTREIRIIFGHWSTLGFLAADNCWALDSGCLWGGSLTGIRLRKRKPIQVFSMDCAGHLRPAS